MGGYTKNIAVIRGLKGGFSVDGGELSGIIKAERYGDSLKIEISLINFAPLTQGKYVCGISDGKNICVIEGKEFEGKSGVDTSEGFAALICFVNEDVSPVASAVCGNFQFATLAIKEEIERQENTNKVKIQNTDYDDEALSEVNYYEYGKTDKDSGALRKDKEEEKEGNRPRKNEKAESAVDEQKKVNLFQGGNFYDKLKGEIENLLNTYPKEEGLERTVENSRWVKIDYGEGKHYVFGVIFGDGEARYICYGVPSTDRENPPQSMQNSSFIPTYPADNGGYWVMYQDAKTGASIKIAAT